MGLGLNGFPLFSLDVVGAVFPPMKLREYPRESGHGATGIYTLFWAFVQGTTRGIVPTIYGTLI